MTDSIDDQVAKRLGWKECQCGPEYRESHKAYMPHEHQIPPYSSSIEAAFEVVEHLKSTENYCVQLNMDDKGAGCWIGTKHRRVAFDEADTAPRAICLAFLKLHEK